MSRVLYGGIWIVVLMSSNAQASGGAGALLGGIFLYALVFAGCMMLIGSALVEKYWRGFYWRTAPLVVVAGFGVSMALTFVLDGVLSALIVLLMVLSPPLYALGLSFKAKR